MAASIFVFLAVAFAPSSFAVDPVYSSPGNASILVLFDLHTGLHDDGSCLNPDLGAIEKAMAVMWSVRENDTGLLLYDTCGTPARALKILQQTFLPDDTAGQQTRIIAGVITHTSSDVNDAIRGPLRLTGVLDVTLTASIPDVNKEDASRSNLYVNMASRRKIQATAEALKQLNWTYITVIFEERVPVQERLYFFQQLGNTDICVQYSTSGSDPHNLLINPADIKTRGIVLFTTDLHFAAEFKRDLPISNQLLVVTDDAAPPVELLEYVMLISETFDVDTELSQYLATSALSSPELLKEMKKYYLLRHNCTFNETSQELLCGDTNQLLQYFSERTRERDIRLLLDAFNFVQSSVQLMVEGQCTKFDVSSCPKLAEILSNQERPSEQFLEVKDGEIVVKPNAIPLGWVAGGNIEKIGEYTASDQMSLFPDVLENITVAGNHGIPESTCGGWCPTCRKCKDAKRYGAEYQFSSGDIILTGLFPFSQIGDAPFKCGQYALQQYANIYAEAFMYAVRNFKVTYPYLLPNVTVGFLMLDTCSDSLLLRKTVIDFETCGYSFPTAGNQYEPSPTTVAGYVLQGTSPETESVSKDFNALHKIGAIVSTAGNYKVNGLSPVDTPVDLGFKAMFQFIYHMNWSHVGIVISEDFDSQERMNALFEMTRLKNVCISYYTTMSSQKTGTIRKATDIVKTSLASVVVVMANSDDIKSFALEVRATSYLSRTWLICDNGQYFKDQTDISLPLGTILFENRGIEDRSFSQSYASLRQSSNNPWTTAFKVEESECTNATCRQQVTGQQFKVASSIIKAVDASLHALHGAYAKLCPDLAGLCKEFAQDGFQTAVTEVGGVEFVYQSEDTIRFTKDSAEVSGAFDIINLQLSGFKGIGGTVNGQLTVNQELLHYYDFDGDALMSPRDSKCYAPCACVNNNTGDSGDDELLIIELNPEMGFKTTSAEFNRKLWSIIVVIIAASGSLITVLLIVYIMCKVCSGALIRRYLVLGVMLLVAVMCLFLSTLPFLFSPSEAVCGMRFFAHGVAFAFCFAVILTKMMSLRDYKHIGLGGEISRINQLLTVFFITGVQIAFAVQWWVLQKPMVIEQIIFTEVENGTAEVTYYACNLDRKDFVAYHSYALFLVFLCCLYSILVRNETQNMREARLLLISSWICLALWIAEVVVLLVLKREHFELIASVGILANALTLMVVIYLPKVNAISKLKYEVTEKRNENGYKVDTDFQYERPYSLPGTMHSSITDKTLSYPRSIATFDTSLSY